MSSKPPHIPAAARIPTPKDTADLSQALIFARSYLDDYYNNKKASNSEDRAALGFASKYLAEARAKDPHVTITTETKEGPLTQTQDMLASEVLYLEACIESNFDLPETALIAIKKAIAYSPDHPYLHRKAAEIFLKLNKRDEAMKAANYALTLNPRDIENRKIVDKIEATPSLGVKQKEPGKTADTIGITLLVIGAVCFFIGPFIAYSQQNYIGMIGVPIIFGVPLIWLGSMFCDSALKARVFDQAIKKSTYER
jgi:tetratricopeptide (TPR) repeat protein